MLDTLTGGAIALSLPATRQMLLVIRLTTAGILTRAGATVDAMDDIKMAVEEACNCFLQQKTPPERLDLTFAPEKGELKIEIDATDGKQNYGEVNEREIEIARCILESLVASADVELLNGRIGKIRLCAVIPQ